MNASRPVTFRASLIGAALLAFMPPLAVQAGETQLWIVLPAAAGALSDCPERAAMAVHAKSADAHLLISEALVRWQGGQIRLAGGGRDLEKNRDLWDKCFALAVDGRVIVSGATLVPHSARLLRFPVLQVLSWRGREEPLEFELVPAFPAGKATISDQEWLGRLAKLR
ncbi:hypothetical protein A6A04_20935 [Paramagnetospirillum marisnigri]|uniref:Uncharacterized protein n=1 Tax=Paramagnetospirillum marisnigri TaxID=1285242 RepID=A0A178MB24_9PROT|nr:hypothetical protein [Paramagnetospirillum marisnigri]OAN45228.1 hypothetical protein A6A04_20935 [Paramagnetospirillum marisnigri]